MLSPRERVVRELDHQEPDRLPWGGENVSRPTADLILGRPAVTGMGGQRRILELQSRGRHHEANLRLRKDTLDLARKLKMDLVAVPRLPPKEGEKPVMLSEHEWTWGGRTVMHSTEGNLLTVETDEAGNRIKHGMHDLEKLVESLESTRGALEERAAEELADTCSLIGELKRKLDCAVLFPVWNCFLTHPDWLLTFLAAFHRRPDLVMRFERAQARSAIAYGERAIEAGADIVGIGGDLAYRKGTMISPENYRRFILPFMKRESKVFHRLGAYTMIASDGNLMPIAEDYFLASGVDAAREIEPGPMDRRLVKELFGHRVCLNGNIDCGRTLGLLGPADVIGETRECIRIWSPGGGHILSSSNTISPNVRPENFLAMMKALFKYGRYRRLTR